LRNLKNLKIYASVLSSGSTLLTAPITQPALALAKGLFGNILSGFGNAFSNVFSTSSFSKTFSLGIGFIPFSNCADLGVRLVLGKQVGVNNVMDCGFYFVPGGGCVGLMRDIDSSNGS